MSFCSKKDLNFLNHCKNCQRNISKLPELFKHEGFTGKLKSSVTVPAVVHNKVANCLFVGMGKKHTGQKSIEIEQFRRAVGTVVRQTASLKTTSLALRLPSAKLFGCTTDYLIKQAVIILNMASYQFADFWTDKERKGTQLIEVMLCGDIKDKKMAQHAIDEGQCIADAVNNTRYLIDMPPSSMTPTDLANKATAIAKKHKDLKLTIFNEKEIIKMGMGGLAGVARVLIKSVNCYFRI